MKRKLLSLFILCLAQIVYSQSWRSATGKLYTYHPDSVKVGIGTTAPSERLHINNGALKIGNTTIATDRQKNLLKFGDGSYVQIGEWEADDQLSFKANKYNFTQGNFGFGVASPQYKLDIAGKVYLHSLNVIDGWGYCYLFWQSHSLVLGTPPGEYVHNSVDLMPGGSDNAPEAQFSRLRMFSAYSTTSRPQKIELCTENHCWFMNAGNFGIGTSTPNYKLDVNGTIRANEVIVNTTGADYVFDADYKLRSLDEVKSYIEENNHLPEVPSAGEMQQKGMSVSEMQTVLLQKIEGLTLYILEQDKRIKELESRTANQ